MEEDKKNVKSEAALREEAILEFWEKNKIFQKSLEKTKGKKEFVFYEGPPTANGNPGIHHLESRAFKDAIPRYKTMQGYHVRRKGGWDTHGLPVELQVEKKLGLNSKKAIEEYGIAKFNQNCKESVWDYLEMWNKFTKRIGYWVDQENPYVTYNNEYIESVWNIVKKIDERELLFKDYKVVPWCPRCGTALSSHELAQGYEDVKDLSIYAKFRLKGAPSEVEGKNPSASSGPININTYLLAWTTTPWTLPGNVALAVGENIDYVKIKLGNEYYILAKERLSVISEPYEIKEEMKGAKLVGIEYEPVFPYFQETISEDEKHKLEKAYKVYTADFVNTEDGTGIVHTAIMYGQDDFMLGTQAGLPKHHLVNLEGKFIKGAGFLEGRFVKEEDGNGKPTLAVDIIKYLTDKNLFFKKENYEHSYPHCWRCKTPLIYYARDSWYIRMSDPEVKNELIRENKEINWEPSHIRDGRFGEWLREIKDWAISRERYWGTPLPVWHCEKCKKREVVGSLSELKEKTKKSGNRYFVIRHGEAQNNVIKFFSVSLHLHATLTEKGKEQIEESIRSFSPHIDMVISSPLERARETTGLLLKKIQISPENVSYDKRLGEWSIDDSFEGRPLSEIKQYYDHDYFENPKEAFTTGENFSQLVKRLGDFIEEIEGKYENKNILVVSHAGCERALRFFAEGYTFEYLKQAGPLPVLPNGSIREIAFTSLPHNADYELDLHRPYIDEVTLSCDCGGELVRTKEVMDVWFDSGAMPFAQDHYPFENKEWVDGPGYPADFISEAIDQTRGWFYTLHAVGTLLGRGKAYKNVICLGHLLDANGKKMSKSLGNIVDPWIMIEKYGVDTLRLWMYSVNEPGESKNFDEKTVALLHNQVFGLLYNCLAFYELYRDRRIEKDQRPKSVNLLDTWILHRLDELIEIFTKNLNNYKLLEGVRATRDFIGDLSTWYLRRSRERIKEGDGEAKATLYFVLLNLSKLLAPFAPFSAEDIWLKLRNESDEESVHLSKWPSVPEKLLGFLGDGRDKVLEDMEKVRVVVSLGLESRQKAGIKVRQPLNTFEVKNYNFSKPHAELIKDELNVKEIRQNKKLEDEVRLDLFITPELKAEGDYRELTRALQEIRKKLGLTPSEQISLCVETNNDGQNLIKKFESDIKKTVVISKIEFKENNGLSPARADGAQAGEEIKVDGLVFKVKIDKM